MAESARDLGHDYIALTDHSPRLTIANGLSAERLREQLKVVAALNEKLAPFRILTGIEVDILEDGSLDQEPDLLAHLDVVVASVHLKLRMDGEEMTRRMVCALANPHMDILGHCTGRIVVGRGRPESSFNAELVFAAAEKFDKAVEINCRPERLDPPKRLLRLAFEMGCKVSIDTDAHAPGQLEWQPYGCERAAECDVPAESIVNAMDADGLAAWTASHANLVAARTPIRSSKTLSAATLSSQQQSWRPRAGRLLHRRRVRRDRAEGRGAHRRELFVRGPSGSYGPPASLSVDKHQVTEAVACEVPTGK
jgi:putative hydrolase